MMNLERVPARWARRLVGAASVIAVVAGLARPALARQERPASAVAQIIATAKPDVPETLTFANRDVVTLRASVLGRSTSDRVSAALRLLDLMVAAGGPLRASLRPVDTALMVAVDGRDVFAILPADVDQLSDETLDAKGAAALAHLQQALDEAIEAESPRLLLRGLAFSAAATVTFILIVWALKRIDEVGARRLGAMTERRLSASAESASELLRQMRLMHYVKRVIDLVSLALALVAAYSWLAFVLRRFPYSRPWGDRLRGFFVSQLEWLALGIIHALPGLVTVALIIIATRILVRIVGLFFTAIEQGRLSAPGLFPDTAAPTRKLVTGSLWLLALIVAYPYLPGSGTDAFKGVSVFLGLVVSLGSTGIVNQVMSGLTITYSRAVRVGDYVQVGDIEGTVKHLGTLSMKVETPRNEDVTIPNTVLISREVINYSRNVSSTDVLVTTSVTIGYDAPWRQVHALLLSAAARTSGVRHTPVPMVLQAGLEDFYVKYLLAFALEVPANRKITLAALHANIQDAFNEFGVQIMSPHYWADPQAPKVVARGHWSPPPAVDPASPGETGGKT